MGIHLGPITFYLLNIFMDFPLCNQTWISSLPSFPNADPNTYGFDLRKAKDFFAGPHYTGLDYLVPQMMSDTHGSHLWIPCLNDIFNDKILKVQTFYFHFLKQLSAHISTSLIGLQKCI